MSLTDAIAKMTAPLRRRVSLMVSRAVLQLVDDAARMQGVQVVLLKGEVRPLERFQNYGLSSHPHPGAEGIAVFVGGNREHGVIVAMDDGRYRPTDIEPGEVVLYDDLGSRVHLKRDGEIHVTASALVVVDAPEAEFTGNVTVAGNLEVTGNVVIPTGNVTLTDGTLTATNGTVTAGGKNLKTHVHSGVTTGGGNTGAPV